MTNLATVEQPERRTSAVNCYRDLRVWHHAMDLVVDVYRLTSTLPREEKYGLVQQMNRAAVSVPSNIAEGHGRDHLGDYLRQLSVANGSLMELETQAQIAVRLGYLSADDGDGLLGRTAEVGRMLAGLVRALKRRALTPNTRHPTPPLL